MKLFLLLFMLFGIHYDDPDAVFEFMTPNNADTLYIDGYTFIELRHKYNPQLNPAFMIIVMKDSSIVLKVADDDNVCIYNFNPDTSQSAKPVYAKDIDHDGVKEMIYCCTSMGTGHYHDVLIYTLEDNPVLKDITTGAEGDELIDLDGDSIPEFVIYKEYNLPFDNIYDRGTFKYYPHTEDMQKWDGQHYRPANLIFKKYRLEYCFGGYKDTKGNPLLENDTLCINRILDLGCSLAVSNKGAAEISNDSSLSSQSLNYPPPAFTELIIYLYDNGYIAEGDSLINTCWKADTSDIRNYLNLFQYYRDSSHIK
jgi:hypothetical protein